MKKFWTIFGITLGSIIGLVLIVACIAVWVVFTPERLTPIARQAADKYITCEHELGEVDLTFFSTFPEFGLRAKGILLINPKAGAQNDTLLAAPEVVATINPLELLNNRRLVVHELSLPDAIANLYIAQDGSTNIDVFAIPEDTTAEEEDTTAFELPFDEIEVNKLAVEANTLTFVDDKDSIDARLYNTELAAKIGSWDDVDISLSSQDVSASLGDTQYAKNLCVRLDVPASVDLDKMRFELRKASVAVNEFSVGLNGTAEIGDTIALNMDVKAKDWQIKPLLALLPAKLQQSLSDLDVDGELSLDAHVEGIYGDNLMPIVDATLELEDGEGAYKQLPYTLRDVEMEADAHIDLNDSLASSVKIKNLEAKTKKTSLQATGQVTELMADMLIDLNMDADVNLPDAAYFLPDGMEVDGKAKGTIGAKIRLSDLTNMRLQKGKFSADLRVRDLKYKMDSMLASLPDSRLQLQLPNAKPSKPKVNWVAAQISTESVEFEMIDQLRASLGNSDIQLEAGNILSNDPVLYATVALQSKDALRAAMDSLEATISAPDFKAYAEYNTKDSTLIPVVNAELTFDDMQGYYTDIVGHLRKSSLTAAMRGAKKNPHQPVLTASVQTNALDANMGEDMSVKTQSVKLSAASRYNANGDNVLLKWNPKLDVDLHEGNVKMASVAENILVPQITFTYSNKDFSIAQSHIKIGKSDFNLSGEVKNIGKWLRGTGVMEGELNFVSDHTDVNELMALFSSDEGSEEAKKDTVSTASQTKETKATATESEANPFLVPLQVDVALNTHIKEAEVFNQVAHDLKGKLYIKDGQLVLDEMGFVCNAAKLQLTAIYRSPRKDHLYVGLDYHMLDVNIEELISMIPQLDSMMPMLRSFKGAAEFHLAAETYLFADYSLKPSTIRGACSIFGKDLVVLDGETFSKISKLLMFNKHTENKVDSISAEATIYKKEIDVYPFSVSIDNYTVAMGGRHNLDMSFDYDINVLSPLYLGVNVSGTLDNLNIKLAKCKFAKDFKPLFHNDVDTRSSELRAMIRESMRKNVKIQ